MCRWYKEGNTYPLEAETRSGNSRDSVTAAVLSLTPSRSDDGAAYRCVVWNRAMPEGSKLEARVTLSVNCKSPAAVPQLHCSHDLITDTCIAVRLSVPRFIHRPFARLTVSFTTPFIPTVYSYFKYKYSRTPLIRINRGASHPDMRKIRIIGFFFENMSQLAVLKLYCYYLHLNLWTTPDLKFQKPQHCTLLNLITGNFKAS